MVTVVDEAFIAGKHFIQNFNKSMQELREDIKDTLELTHNLDKVNLQCIHETNPEAMRSKFLQINGRSNKLNLSEELLNKLLSGEKVELTALEINELNCKIKLALTHMKKDGVYQHFLKEEQAKFEVGDRNINLIGIPDRIQSDTSSSETSTVLSSAYNLSRTKLMNLISQEDKIIVPPKEKVEIGKTNWWEREATQFMRGIMVRRHSEDYLTDLLIFILFRMSALT